MQELYNQKQILKEEIEKSEHNLEDLKSTKLHTFKTDDEYKYRLNTVSAYEDLVKYPMSNIYLGEEKENTQITSERVKDEALKNVSSPFRPMSAKPPVAPSKNTVTFLAAADDEASNRLMQKLDSGIKKIETMWDNFSLSETNANLKSIEFNEKFEKKLKRVNPKKRQQLQVEWVPRVTIPEPFSMSIREQIKQDKKQQKLLKEMQEERERRIEAEIKECKRKFKAQPVPAHVNLPIYEQRRLDEELRKYKLKEMSKEYMEKISRPFNLTDTTKKFNPKETAAKTAADASQYDVKKKEFNAQPLPDFYFNEYADEE